MAQVRFEGRAQLTHRAVEPRLHRALAAPQRGGDLAGRVAADYVPELAEAGRQLRTAVRAHLRAISERYIIEGETADGALMFLPSEAVYAELHANFAEIVREGFALRVWIVSPTTCMATLNTMRAVLKDARMREQAGAIRKTLGLLHREDVDRAHALHLLAELLDPRGEDLELLGLVLVGERRRRFRRGLSHRLVALAGHVVQVHGGLGGNAAVGLARTGPVHQKVCDHVSGSVADIDLAAGDVVLAPVECHRSGQAGNGMLWLTTFSFIRPTRC